MPHLPSSNLPGGPNIHPALDPISGGSSPWRDSRPDPDTPVIPLPQRHPSGRTSYKPDPKYTRRGKASRHQNDTSPGRAGSNVPRENQLISVLHPDIWNPLVHDRPPEGPRPPSHCGRYRSCGPEAATQPTAYLPQVAYSSPHRQIGFRKTMPARQLYVGARALTWIVLRCPHTPARHWQSQMPEP